MIAMAPRPQNVHERYHAHVYFDAATAVHARTLHTAAAEDLNVKVGRFHEKHVGPHPCWSFQVAFEAEAFGTVIGWLDKRRKGLTIFVHGRTGDDYADHTDFAYWLGEPRGLNLALFERTTPAHGAASNIPAR